MEQAVEIISHYCRKHKIIDGGIGVERRDEDRREIGGGTGGGGAQEIIREIDDIGFPLRTVRPGEAINERKAAQATERSNDLHRVGYRARQDERTVFAAGPGIEYASHL